MASKDEQRVGCASLLEAHDNRREESSFADHRRLLNEKSILSEELCPFREVVLAITTSKDEHAPHACR